MLSIIQQPRAHEPNPTHSTYSTDSTSSTAQVMNVGIVCYASVGGSGVVATELAHALAERGHRVHLISSEPPFRWRPEVQGLSFERVSVPSYPLFREPQYLLALATTISRVAEQQRLDIVHAHYAVPHATAAYLADQILSAAPGCVQPRTITTLHGTDITLVGSDPSYARVVAFSIERSHGVTAVSESLKADTMAGLGVQRDISVIPNFLDCAAYRRRHDAALRAQYRRQRRSDYRARVQLPSGEARGRRRSRCSAAFGSGCLRGSC